MCFQRLQASMDMIVAGNRAPVLGVPALDRIQALTNVLLAIWQSS